MSRAPFLRESLIPASGPIELLAPSATRDCVRLLEVDRDGSVRQLKFYELPTLLRAGDLLVVNDSGTMPRALAGFGPEGGDVILHLSTRDAKSGLQLLEVRQPEGFASRETDLCQEAFDVQLEGGGLVHVLAADLTWDGSSRVRSAMLELPHDLDTFCHRFGSPIRYRHVSQPWTIDAYQTVFAAQPGSSEMPSAARPFSRGLVEELRGAEVSFACVTLHTGVASLEGSELPRPEPYFVTSAAAEAINHHRREKGRVIAVGTSVVRALTASTDSAGQVHAGEGYAADLVGITSFPTNLCDGLITGWHDPVASHLGLLRQLASERSLIAGYATAAEFGYLSHEFGDSNLIWL